MNVLVRVTDALALVGLRRTERANLRRRLSDSCLSDALEHDLGLGRRLGRHAFRQCVLDRVRQAERAGSRCRPSPRRGNPRRSAAACARNRSTRRSTMLPTSTRMVPASASAEVSALRGAKLSTLSSWVTCTDSCTVIARVALATLDRDRIPVERHFDALGQDHGILRNSGHGSYLSINSSHQNTVQRTSPPTPAARAARSVITPLLVDTMAMPSPPRTFGSSSLPA